MNYVNLTVVELKKLCKEYKLTQTGNKKELIEKLQSVTTPPMAPPAIQPLQPSPVQTQPIQPEPLLIQPIQQPPQSIQSVQPTLTEPLQPLSIDTTLPLHPHIPVYLRQQRHLVICNLHSQARDYLKTAYSNYTMPDDKLSSVSGALITTPQLVFYQGLDLTDIAITLAQLLRISITVYSTKPRSPAVDYLVDVVILE